MNFQKCLEIAIIAAKRAASLIIENDGIIMVNKSEGKDVKLQTDVDSEQVIIEVLKKYTNFSILSEESGLVDRSRIVSYKWIVDPIDGSLNYLRGIPLSCISIALWDDFEPVLGVVYDFNADLLYSGIIGEGAWCNGESIKVSDILLKENAIICTGFPVYTSFDEDKLLNFVQIIRQYKKVRLFGSAALSLCFVAKGSAEVYMEENIALWDVAAGLAVLKAAGGCCDYAFTNKEKNLLIVNASNSKEILI